MSGNMSEEEGIAAAKNCYNLIKPDGYLRCAVPDVNFRNEAYQNIARPGRPGSKDHSAYSHKIVCKTET